MKHIEVSAAIVIDKSKILCVQRDTNKFDYISLKYEFPGGKVETGETKEQAVLREIQEELNLEIEIISHLCTVTHEYPDFIITMHGFICSSKNIHEMKLKEHIDYRWLSKADLMLLDWAQADVPIVKRLMEERGV